VIVDLDGFVAETTPAPDSTTFKLTGEGLVNWYSSPPVISDVQQNPQDDSDYAPERTYRKAKTMSLEGWVQSTSPEAAVIEGWQRVSSLAPLGGSMNLHVTDPTGEYDMTVWLNGGPSVIPFTQNRAKFQIPLIAPDGRKYRAQEPLVSGPGGDSPVGLVWPLFGAGYLDFGSFSPSGLFYVTNNGTAESWPVFKVRGGIDASGFQILSTAGLIEYTAAVPSGQEVVLSPYAGGRATVSGVDVTGDNLTQADWPSILPKETRSYIFNPLGTADANAQITLNFSDAWW
jgi:hypothetical protein